LQAHTHIRSSAPYTIDITYAGQGYTNEELFSALAYIFVQEQLRTEEDGAAKEFNRTCGT